jgi:glycosyltransferase EpsE
MKRKVSVIMGVFNCATTLPTAIESVINQSFKDWELIICDDGSSDQSYCIAKAYQEKYGDQIILLSNEKNLGLNITLNNCLRASNGKYIARMDGDDISLPDRFQTEVDFLDEHPEYAIVSSPMIYFDDQGDFKIGKQCGEPIIHDFAKGTQFCHAPCMVRREAYLAVNGYSISAKRLRVEDWDLWIRMYEKGFKGFNLSSPLYKMRDDRNAYKRRRYKFRINEARVSISAVKKLHLKKIYYIYAFKPIIVGLLPSFVYMYLHKK